MRQIPNDSVHKINTQVKNRDRFKKEMARNSQQVSLDKLLN